MGLFSGFGNLGLGDLDGVDLFEDKTKEEKAKAAVPPREEDFLLDKMVACPVCDRESSQKIMKTGKAKLLSTDIDLRPVYSLVDGAKYEVYQCSFCGYAGLAKSFARLSTKQVALIEEGICSKVILRSWPETPTYSYDQCMERYQLALASTVVKKGKASEKAYICMKTAWLLRGYADYEKVNGNNPEKLAQIQAAEKDYLTKAYQGFAKAASEESFPVCGMDETTIDYLLGAIALEIGRTDVAGRMISKVLQNPNAPSRAKDRARSLKDILMEEIKRNKQSE